MSGERPDHPHKITSSSRREPVADEPVLAPSDRNALLRELSPTRADRARVQAGIAAALGSATDSPLVRQVDAQMVTRAAKLKAATARVGKSSAAKWVASSLVITSAAAITTGGAATRFRSASAGATRHPDCNASASGGATRPCDSRRVAGEPEYAGSTERVVCSRRYVHAPPSLR